MKREGDRKISNAFRLLITHFKNGGKVSAVYKVRLERLVCAPTLG